MSAVRDQNGPTVTVRLRVDKFDGDVEPGKKPVETIETEQTMTLPEFMKMQTGWGE